VNAGNMWGEQAACILATKERTRYQKLLSVGDNSCRKLVAHCWHQSIAWPIVLLCRLA